VGTDLRLVFDPPDGLLKSARECEAEVFLRWFGNTRDQLAEEYGPYEDASVFVAVADDQDEVRAAARLLVPGGAAGLKTLADVENPPWGANGDRVVRALHLDLSSTWEVATLGARARTAAEGERLSMALYHALMTIAQVNDMSAYVAILDHRVRRLLSSVGILTRPLPGTFPTSYLGSESSVPVYAHYAPMRDAQRRRFPDAYRLVTLGAGLDGISVPGMEQFQLRPRLRVDLTRFDLPAPRRSA
jgi:hypothetical protein